MLKTYHRPLETVGVLFQFLQGIGLPSRSLNYLACSSSSRSNVFEDSPELVARRRVFGDVKLELCPLKLVLFAMVRRLILRGGL